MEARVEERVLKLSKGKRGQAKVNLQYSWLPLRKVSKHLVHAVIVAEDGRFYEHAGFDWYELGESVEKNWQTMRFARGASTITQQVAKNLFLSHSKTPLRKAKEWLITFLMEQVMSKDRILEIYLNIIEWGDLVFGVESAAQYYYGKSATHLSREESARLASVIPSPRKWKVHGGPKFINRRTETILIRMSARGW